MGYKVLKPLVIDERPRDENGNVIPTYNRHGKGSYIVTSETIDPNADRDERIAELEAQIKKLTGE